MARISVPCDDRLAERLAKCFPWGTQAQAIRRVCELLCDRIEKEGPIAIAELINGRFNILEQRGKLK